jgi:diguanylate cyclase (GGDEF)-like protein
MLEKRQRRRWMALPVLLVAAGAAGSVLGARAVASNDAQRSHQALVSSSIEIAASLKLVIAEEENLVISMEAFVAANPDVSNTPFLNWVRAMHVKTRYPEVVNLGFTAFVRPAQLPQFITRVLADPPTPLPPGQTYQVTPPGDRPIYCLAQLKYTNGGPYLPLDYDACTSGGSRETAGIALLISVPFQYRPVTLRKVNYLVVDAPVYPGGGVIPATAAARNDAVLGAVGLTTRPGSELTQALAGRAGTALTLTFSYGSGSTKITFKAGRAPAGAQSATVDLHNGWHVQVFAAVDGPGVLGNSNALALVLAGLALSLLLGALIYVLSTGRSRALGLVDKRTRELHHLALHDPLTGLPNRALILDRVHLMLARSRREHTPVAVLFLDLDNFKDINDTLGHAAGDQLLAGVAARLVSAIREEDTVGRLGGDEFVVLAEGASLDAGVQVVADRILDVMATPFEIADSEVPLSVTASIGIAEGRRATPDDLLRDADIALYQAKEAGKKCSVVFAPEMQDSVNDHRRLEVDLSTALGADQFFLLYQPVVDLSSGVVTGVEALLRWRHPIRGVLQPDDFIPALESSGLIVPVGRWVLEEACRQGAIWEGQGHRMAVAVNISARQLDRDQIVDDVQRALTTSGFDPTLCVLELTETTLMHNVADTVVRLTRLKALGVRLAVDDFGTGYSSMAYLRRFPVDMLKIDRSFVSGIADTPEAPALIRTMVELGKALGLETVAEGVETDAQRAHLTAQRVDTAQGFLFARPLDVEAVNRLLEDSRNEIVPGNAYL